MQLQLEINGSHPPVGHIEVAGRSRVPFMGWLGLLAALGDLLVEVPADGCCDEAGPGRDAELAEDT